MTITLAVTLDIDQDGLSFGTERNALSWNAVATVPRLAELFASRGVRATWFVRADNQLRDFYGSSSYLLERFADLWSSLERDGHAIAWHPHVYRRGEDGAYVVETDGERCAEHLARIYAELRAAGRTFAVARIGEAFHSNRTMQMLDELGVVIDSTAVPGRRRDDGGRFFDWEPTTNAPYHPSRSDYRVPGSDALSILEVPMTSIPILAPYDRAPLRRYINLAFRSDLLIPAIEAQVESLSTIVTITHPEEVMGSPPNPLYGEGVDNVARNLDALLRIDARKVTMNDVANEAKP